MTEKMNLTESLLFDDEFLGWLEKSDKMYAKLNEQPVQQPVATQQPMVQPAQQPVAQPAQPAQQAQTTPQAVSPVKTLVDTWAKQLNATTKDARIISAFQAFSKLVQ